MPLDPRTASLVRLSSLAVRPHLRDDLYAELRLTNENGTITREDLHEAFLQLYLFAGFPAALEAMRALARTWPQTQTRTDERSEAAIQDYPAFREQGEALYKRVYANNADRVREEMLKLSPELAAWALVEGYGKTLSRPGLDAITRELCIVGMLTQLGWERQLYSHLLGARNVGASAETVREAVHIGALGNADLAIAAEQLIKKVV
jgi:4-carboxymuconolactone decarboxylase